MSTPDEPTQRSSEKGIAAAMMSWELRVAVNAVAFFFHHREEIYAWLPEIDFWILNFHLTGAPLSPVA